MTGSAPRQDIEVTTNCTCWRIVRSDGTSLGFTDHDLDLEFGGRTFRASEGMSARALEQSTGLAVDNTEAFGALSDSAITEADIAAGRYDGAEVTAWRVDWSDPSDRRVIFRGMLGEIERAGGAFRAELRGLTEALNRPQGRLYQAPCSAILGDKDCRADLGSLALESKVLTISGDTGFSLSDGGTRGSGWYERGKLHILDGAAAGLIGVIKRDDNRPDGRYVELWEGLRAPLSVGDRVRLEPGCDKRAETCRQKFQNLLNFRGFPDIPSTDWLMSYPTRGGGGR